jgi:hypothetical protein
VARRRGGSTGLDIFGKGINRNEGLFVYGWYTWRDKSYQEDKDRGHIVHSLRLEMLKRKWFESIEISLLLLFNLEIYLRHSNEFSQSKQINNITKNNKLHWYRALNRAQKILKHILGREVNTESQPEMMEHIKSTLMWNIKKNCKAMTKTSIA